MGTDPYFLPILKYLGHIIYGDKMARKKRIFGDTGIYHIVLRGNNQQSLFYDNHDREFFLNRLKRYVTELKIDLYAYCLMGNHVHILIGKGNELMPLFVKKIACSYVYYFNKKYERTGHLFQGRYKSEPVEDIEYFKTVYRYIIKNPEKAAICVYNRYAWSSYSLIDAKNTYLNNGFVQEVFLSMNHLYAFLQKSEEDNCMEDHYILDSDDDIKGAFIEKLFNIKSPTSLCREPYSDLMSKLKRLKMMGISINQLSRLTGISKHIIKRA